MEIGNDLQIAEALGAHHAQHGIRLTDTNFKIEPSADDQCVFPLADNGGIKIINLEKLTILKR